MSKFTAILTITALFALLDYSTALQCYTCDTACSVDKATKIECGKNIGASHEAVCVLQFPKGKEGAKEKLRGCKVVNKGEEPSCPQADQCNKCNTDLCNAAPSTGANMLVAIAAVFLAKYLL